MKSQCDDHTERVPALTALTLTFHCNHPAAVYRRTTTLLCNAHSSGYFRSSLSMDNNPVKKTPYLLWNRLNRSPSGVGRTWTEKIINGGLECRNCLVREETLRSPIEPTAFPKMLTTLPMKDDRFRQILLWYIAWRGCFHHQPVERILKNIFVAILVFLKYGFKRPKILPQISIWKAQDVASNKCF